MKLFKEIKQFFEGEVITSPLFNREDQVYTNSKFVNIDEMIFNAVTNAENDIYSQSKSYVENTKELEIKINDYQLQLQHLEKLGFTNQPDVVKNKANIEGLKKQQAEVKKKLAESQNLIKAIDYYRSNHNNKFIDQATVDKVCKDFGLIYGSVDKYIAEIPKKNVDEIVNFRVKAKDVLFPIHYSLSSIYPYDSHIKKYFTTYCNYKFMKELQQLSYDDVTKAVDRTLRYTNKLSIKEPIAYTEEIGLINLYKFRAPTDPETHIKGTGLLILGPSHKFDLSGDEVVNNEIVKKTKTVKIKDPVVLQPVEGGYLIVSMWGFESTLPEFAGKPNVNIYNNSN